MHIHIHLTQSLKLGHFEVQAAAAHRTSLEVVLNGLPTSQQNEAQAADSAADDLGDDRDRLLGKHNKRGEKVAGSPCGCQYGLCGWGVKETGSRFACIL